MPRSSAGRVGIMTDLQLILNDKPIAASSPPTLTEWQPVEFACVPPSGAALTLSIGGPFQQTSLQPFLRPGDTAWRWRWNPQNSAGRVVLTLCATWPDGHTEEVHIWLEILPRKIDQERYTLLLDDLRRSVQRVVYALTGAVAGASFHHSDNSAPGEPGLRNVAEEYAHFFAERMDALEQAVESIARQPHTLLRSITEQVASGQLHDLSPPLLHSLSRAVVQPGNDWLTSQSTNDENATTSSPPAAQRGQECAGSESWLTGQSMHPLHPSSLPAKVEQPCSITTTDTPENRLIKQLLTEVRRRVRLLTDLAPRNMHDTIAEQCRTLEQRIKRLHSLPFLTQVADSMGPALRSPTHVIQRNPSYRFVYRFWRELRRDPLLNGASSDLFGLPIAELPYLYECWCVVQVVQALLDLPGAVMHTHTLLDTPAWSTFRLVEERPLLVLNWHEIQISLRYQPRYRPIPSPLERDLSESIPTAPAIANSLDRHTHIPDLALELVSADGPLSIIVFDAKYRLSGSGGVPEDALADAYTYLGSIGLPNGQRAVRAAVLLYPGAGTGEHYLSGVSIVPLLPGGVDMGNVVRQLLRSVISCSYGASR